MPEEVQPAATAIQRQQAEAFARDAFSAGTTLYPDVGQPAPVDDTTGRIAQARIIAERRGLWSRRSPAKRSPSCGSNSRKDRRRSAMPCARDTLRCRTT